MSFLETASNNLFFVADLNANESSSKGFYDLLAFPNYETKAMDHTRRLAITAICKQRFEQRYDYMFDSKFDYLIFKAAYS